MNSFNIITNVDAMRLLLKHAYMKRLPLTFFWPSFLIFNFQNSNVRQSAYHFCSALYIISAFELKQIILEELLLPWRDTKWHEAWVPFGSLVFSFVSGVGDTKSSIWKTCNRLLYYSLHAMLFAISIYQQRQRAQMKHLKHTL